MKTTSIGDAVAFGIQTLIASLVVIAVLAIAFHAGEDHAGRRKDIVAPANHPCLSVCASDHDGLTIANITRREALPTREPIHTNVLDGGVR
jgi:hypothetical protein